LFGRGRGTSKKMSCKPNDYAHRSATNLKKTDAILQKGGKKKNGQRAKKIGKRLRQSKDQLRLQTSPEEQRQLPH